MKLLRLLILLCFLLMNTNIFAETLHTGISKVELIPESFYGSWRVVAKIDKQTNGIYFKPQTIDLWNLSRTGDVINLNNPFTGASATVKVDYVEGNLIRFTKIGEYDNKKLTDTVDLKINGDTFTGINTLSLETYSNIDNSLIKKESAIYIIQGEKISGSSISKEE